MRREHSVGQKHSIFVCRASGAFNSFITKIACSEVPSGFEPRYVTVSIFSYICRTNLYKSL